MKHVDERENTIFDRIAVALLFALVWSIFGTGKMGFISESIMCLILVFCSEYSYEYYGGKLHIRSAGQRWLLTGVVKIIVWPIMKPLDFFFGVKNFPALAVLMTMLYVYVWLAGYQFLDQFIHVCLLWYLYHMRKENK